MPAALFRLCDQRTRPATISGKECVCVKRDDALHFRVVGCTVLFSLSGSSSGPPRSGPVIADGDRDKTSGIRDALNKKALSQGLCFCSSVPSFCRKTTPSKSSVLDSTCRLPKELAANAPVPASNGHHWSIAVSGKVDLFFSHYLFPLLCFFYPSSGVECHSQHRGAPPEVA